MTFDIRDYGAVGDGKTQNAEAIQKAIDACTAQGGGIVLVAGGTYTTGKIVMKSNVNLHLEADGILLASPHCEDFPETGDFRHVNPPMLPRERGSSMIYADEAENISITGNGVIDGNGDCFVTTVPGAVCGWKYQRIDAPTPPRVVFFTGCRNVLVEDVSMRNQPSGWSYWIHDCDLVTFDRCKILADVHYPNNDGIHINSSRDVTISNCLIRTGDDSLIIRANNASLKENKVCERVTVTNCNLTAFSAGIRVGWLNDGIIRNCSFSNLVMTDCTNGISIRLPERTSATRIPDEGREDTLIENITFNTIIMDRVRFAPVYIHISDTPVTRCAGIHDLHFNHIYATSIDFPILEGRADALLRNIYFDDCKFRKLDPNKVTDMEMEHRPAPFGRESKEHHNPTFRFIENLVMTNVTFSSED